MNKLHLLLGPELGDKSAHLKKIRKSLAADTDMYKFYPGEDDLDQLLSSVKNEALFSSGKLVLIMNADQLNPGQVKQLSAYCGKPSPDCVMVFISDQIKISQALMKKIPKDSTVIFWELFENKKRDWLNSFFHKAGKKIEKDAVELILELLENNTLELKRECSHLVSYFSKEDLITEKHVEDFMFHSKEENMFTLFRRIALLQYNEALDIFRKLLDSGEIQTSQLIGMLYWQFKRLSDYVRLSEQRFHPNEICEKLNIRGKRNQQQYRDARRNFTSSDCGNILALFASYDRILKEARGNMGRIQAELFLYYLVVRKGKKSSMPLTLAWK